MTGERLRRAVAEWQGWKVENVDQYGWCLLDTGGKIRASLGHVASTSISVDLAWDVLINMSSDEDYMAGKEAARKKLPIVPDYPGDLNAAFTLTVDGALLQVEECATGEAQGRWAAIYYSRVRTGGVAVWADTPARAICKAYVAFCQRARSAPADAEGASGDKKGCDEHAIA